MRVFEVGIDSLPSAYEKDALRLPRETEMEPGSTPAPASCSESRIGFPAVTFRVRSVIVGGVVSLTQKRNVNPPGVLPVGVSKTKS